MNKELLINIMVGLGVTALFTLGAALINLGPTEDLNTWGRNLLFAEAASVGGYIVNAMRGLLPKPPA